MSKTQNPNLIVREAKPYDAAAIGRLLQLSWLATYPNDELGITKQDIEALALDSDEHTKRRAEKLAKSDEKLRRLIAEVNGEVVAQCGFEYHPEYGYLRSLYVLPNYVSQGIGAALMVKALEMMHRYDRIYLAVATYNNYAIGFYKRFGFQKTEEGPAFTASPFASGKVLP